MIAAGIEYAEAGAGPPVICLHGIGGGCESFLAQMPCAGGFAPPSASPRGGLAPQPPQEYFCQDEEGAGLTGYRVIAWNMPGYGASEPGQQPPSFTSLSDALGGLVAALGLGPVHLVGQSIGGMVALDHALRRADQVATLTLIATTPSFGGRDEAFKDAFLKARLAPLDDGQSMAGMAAHAASRLVGPDASSETIVAIEAPMERVPQAIWRGILQCLVTFNRRGDLARVALPCCLIAGGHDRNAPARTMEKMAAKLPNSEYHLIESAGHMINQEAPDETNAIITAFLDRHSR